MDNPRYDEVVLQAKIPTPGRIASYGKREDGTAKGPGFFGEVSEVDAPDLYATELPIAIIDPFNGAVKVIPLITGQTTYEELVHLVTGGRPTPAMVRWATEWAMNREARGRSAFAEFGEHYPLPVKQEGADAAH